ncbi:MAG: hypothetical protein P8048_10755 [Calditrichia bacterium]
MRFFNLCLILVLSNIFLLKAEQPFEWGDQQIIARRMEMKDGVKQNMQDVDSDYSGTPVGNQRSIGKAGAFSLLVPGSGQFYSNSYIKSAIFLAIEIGAWATNISYHKKGDNKDREFKNYANNNWSERRYWSYLNYTASKDPNYTGQIFPYEPDPNHDWYLISEDYYSQNKDQIISTLRQYEADKFRHRLPGSKTQQYYEMIGKYPHQFGAAWSDASFDIIYSGPDNITSNNNFYMDMREEANRLYDKAQYGLMVALVNHVVSAIDAGFTARSFNREHMKVEMSYRNIIYKGEYVNMFGVNMKW